MPEDLDEVNEDYPRLGSILHICSYCWEISSDWDGIVNSSIMLKSSMTKVRDV